MKSAPPHSLVITDTSAPPCTSATCSPSNSPSHLRDLRDEGYRYLTKDDHSIDNTMMHVHLRLVGFLFTSHIHMQEDDDVRGLAGGLLPLKVLPQKLDELE